MVIYLDTSALLKLYIEEEGREVVVGAVASGELLATSIIAYAVRRASLPGVRSQVDERGERGRVGGVSIPGMSPTPRCRYVTRPLDSAR